HRRTACPTWAVCTDEPHRRTSEVTLTHTGAARSARPFTATALGAPRIGPNRELKKAVEAYWAGTLDRRSLRDVAAGLRRDDRARLTMAGRPAGPDDSPGGRGPTARPGYAATAAPGLPRPGSPPSPSTRSPTTTRCSTPPSCWGPSRPGSRGSRTRWTATSPRPAAP